MTLPYEIVVLDVGGAALVYPWSRAGQADPELSGGISRAYAGNQYSSIVAEFMVVPLVSQHRTSAEYGAVKALFAKGAQRPCQGKVFNPNTVGVVTCSGKVTGEMEPGFVDDTGEPLWTINLTLTEVDNADTAVATDTTIYLTPIVSPDDATKNLASTNVADDPFLGFGGTGGVTLVTGITIPTCGTFPDPTLNCSIVVSPAVEVSFLTKPATADGWLTGTPRVVFLSSGGTSAGWQTQAYFAQIFVVRSGSDVAEFDTGYSDTNGGAFSADSTATGSPIIFPIVAGDQLRIDIVGRAGLHGGYADDGVHQLLVFGNGGSGLHYGRLLIGGNVLFE